MLQRRAHPLVLQQDKEQKCEAEQQQVLTHLMIPSKKYLATHPRQISVSNALVEFVAEDLMPLSVVDSTRFRNLVSILEPCYQMPSRKQLSTVLLKKKYDTLRSKVVDQLQKIKSLNITVDLWSNRQMKSYLGMTGHYISNQWTLESVMLACNRVTGGHTSDNIMLWYNEVVSEFDVRDKIKHVVTDSAANIKKAFLTLPGFENDTSDSDIEDEDDDDIEGEYSSKALLLQSDLEHHSCFAHILQLVVKDGIAKAGPISTVIKKCSKFVSFLRKSTIATDTLQDTIRIQGDNITRWNSQLQMIKSVLSISPDIFLKLIEIDGAPKLNSHDKNLLQDIVEILEPFAEATDFVQVGCIPSAGYVLPCIKGLKHHLKNMVSKYHSSFVIGLTQSLNKRLPYFENKETYILASVLDPRFKLRWCCDDNEKPTITELLKAEVEIINSSSSVQPAIAESRTTEPPPKKAKSLFSFMPSESSAVVIAGSDNISTNIDAYLEAPAQPIESNPLTFWDTNSKKFPLLAVLAKEILSVPSSSSPVERLFSIAGKIFRPERCNLRDNKFQQLMFIRCNNTHT